MKEILAFIQTNMVWIIIGVVALLAYRRMQSRGSAAVAPAIAPAISVPNVFGSAVVAVAVVASIAVAATAFIAVWNPGFFSSVSSIKGPFGPDRRISEVRADVVEEALTTDVDASTWKSEAAQAVAGVVVSEYQLATAKNKTAKLAAAAEAACYLPKGHLDRVLWDAAGLDPCEASVPAGLQASTRAVAKTTGEVAKNAGDAAGKIDLAALDKESSKPLGQASADADSWLRQIYNLPKGILWIAGLLLAIMVLGRMATSLLKALLRAP